MFFIDEAYYEFSGSTVVNLISNYSNLIIFRTFSKAFGLAGIRLGYIISNKYNIEVINKIRNGKEVSSIAQLAASCILENYGLVKQRVNELIITRNLFFDKLNNLSNYEVFPSSANFLLLRHVKSKEIIFALNQCKILVRDRSSMHLLDNCFRITIGTKDEMERVLNVLKQY
jgi:histidinol-phosphate aminotransferase